MASNKFGLNDVQQLDNVINGLGKQSGANYIVGFDHQLGRVTVLLNDWDRMALTYISPDQAELMGLRLIAAARQVRGDNETVD